MALSLQHGASSKFKGNAIVNAANSRPSAWGGVVRAISDAAGPGLDEKGSSNLRLMVPLRLGMRWRPRDGFAGHLGDPRGGPDLRRS